MHFTTMSTLGAQLIVLAQSLGRDAACYLSNCQNAFEKLCSDTHLDEHVPQARGAQLLLHARNLANCHTRSLQELPKTS